MWKNSRDGTMAWIYMMGKRRNEVAHPAEVTATGELWGGQGCSTRARKGLRGEALDAKLQ